MRRAKKKPAPVAPAPPAAPPQAPDPRLALHEQRWFEAPLRNPGQDTEEVLLGPGGHEWVLTGNPRSVGQSGGFLPGAMAQEVQGLALGDARAGLVEALVRVETSLETAQAAWATAAMRSRSQESPGLIEETLRQGLVVNGLRQRASFLEQMIDALEDGACAAGLRVLSGDGAVEGSGESDRAADGA